MSEIKFFPSARRRVRLQDYRQLLSKAPEATERKKLEAEMLLIEDDGTVGMPEWLSNAWEFLLKNPDATRINFPALEYKCVTIEVFHTPKARGRELLMTGCDLNGFHIVTVGEEEDAEQYLCFHIYAKDSEQLHALAKSHFHKDVFLTFEEQQRDLPLANGAATLGPEQQQLGAAKRAPANA